MSGAHTKDGLYLLWACGHGPVGLAKPYLIFYPLHFPIAYIHGLGLGLGLGLLEIIIYGNGPKASHHVGEDGI